ncbi:MAG: VRR-NUC domain-containing protein [Treponema sp.]|jgi:hypothetical protein|nr:VRR-NUC domain-containing protein [Treponema sp.]
MAESEVVRACREYLLLRGHFVVRINGGAFRTERGGFMRCTDTNGTPDFMGVTLDGRPLAVEAKSGKGRMSESQKAFREAWVKRCGIFVVARNIEDLQEAGL